MESERIQQLKYSVVKSGQTIEEAELFLRKGEWPDNSISVILEWFKCGWVEVPDPEEYKQPCLQLIKGRPFCRMYPDAKNPIITAIDEAQNNSLYCMIKTKEIIQKEKILDNA